MRYFVIESWIIIKKIVHNELCVVHPVRQWNDAQIFFSFFITTNAMDPATSCFYTVVGSQ